jgi:23S rRNA pseudouridine1911/1915/1917 synthase
MVELQGIRIIYEDNHLLVVEKPINVPVCEDSSRDRDMLSILKEYIKVRDKKPGNVYLGLVHRLDRPVGGVMVFAKTSKAASRLSEQVRNKDLKKVYYAVVEGNISNKGHLVDYMAKDEKRNMSYVTDEDKGKIAILDYEVMGRKNNLNLVRIELVTGRSHQIRVQFSSRGNPLVGDARYNKDFKVGTQIALVAKELSFRHPISKEVMSFSIDLPKRYPFNLF